MDGKNITLSCQERENVQDLINEKLETQSSLKLKVNIFFLIIKEISMFLF